MISWLRVAALALVPALAVALGGSVSRGAQGAVLLFMGLCMLAFPVRLAPPRWLWAGALLLALWPLAAFLPAGAPEAGSWRAALAASGLPDGPLRTLQPWLTLESAALLAAVLAWAAYLACQTLDEQKRAFWLQIHVGGMALLAGAALVCHFAQAPIPLWPEDRFGPFPNRNQTGNVFALAGFLAFALGLRELRHGRRTGVAWLASAALLLAAVLANGSRAGLILLAAGAGAWMAWEMRGARRASWPALVASGLLLLAAAGLLFGGEALDRLLATARDAGQWTADARVAIQRDALSLALAHPLAGAGLGNFDGAFASFREHYQGYARPIHPESDWLWLAGEAGLPAVLLAAALAGAWFHTTWPRADDRDRRLRRAALVAAGLFLLHSLIDVPGHRLGSVLCALTLIPVAWPVRPPHPSSLRCRLWMAGAGLAVAALGACFLAQASGRLDAPGQVRRERLLAEIEASDRAGLHYDAINACEAGAALAPLDWRFHFYSARARLRTNIGWNQAAREFARARLLEPDSPQVVFQEGQFWIGRDPARALDAWAEALRRSDRPAQLFREMLASAQGDPRLLARMDALVELHPQLDFFFLRKASDEVFNQRLAELLKMGPEEAGFRPEDAGEFFSAWRTRRGDELFVRQLAAHPSWEKAGWWWAAQALAQERRWEEALALADRYLARPALPPPEDPVRAGDTVRRHPDDLPAGFALAAADARAGDWRAAASRLERLCADPAAPDYFHHQLAEALRQSGRPEEAWKALNHYIHLSR